MNNLQKINKFKNYFVSINPYNMPKILLMNIFLNIQYLIFKTINAQKKLGSIQGKKILFIVVVIVDMDFMRMEFNQPHILLKN